MDMRSAGYVPPGSDSTSKDCLSFGERPSTPEHIAKWRTTQKEPGTASQHPGLHDFKPPKDIRYGIESSASDHVEQVFPHGPQTEMGQYMNGRAEGIYRLRSREPLDFSESSKGLLYPEDRDDDASKDEIYKKSHGNFGPGEQRRRNYDWKVDPATHRFGKIPPRREKEAVKKVLNPDADEEFKKPAIIPKTVDDARFYKADQLGRVKAVDPRQSASLTQKLPDRAGKSTVRAAHGGTADCLRGDYTVDDQMPDTDLGRATRAGFRNIATDPDRVFGVPTIRRDIAPPSKPSVSDGRNFGDGTNAGMLVNPARHAYRGVDDGDFIQARGAADIRRIFQRAGTHLADDEFSAIWQRAAEHYDLNGNGIVSVEEFRLALNEYLDSKEEGTLPDWFTDLREGR